MVRGTPDYWGRIRGRCDILALKTEEGVHEPKTGVAWKCWKNTGNGFSLRDSIRILSLLISIFMLTQLRPILDLYLENCKVICVA
jgi:hypothetical protein